MASCKIEVVNPSVLSKIESFLNDSSYREAIENSATYNTRLCIERRLRMPFLDSQTGVAQNHSNLFMSPRQRIPGLIEGQIYTYPSKRWRKRRRQYLSNFMQPRRKEVDTEAEQHSVSAVETIAATNEDSKDSLGLKDETTKVEMIKEAWYYDDLDMQEMEAFDDPDPDSDYDYEEPYAKRKGKRRGTKIARSSDAPANKKPKGPGRGRKKANYDALTDADKPFACELCGARYKTRPGLTYHYTHSHKDRDEDESLGSDGVPSIERGSSPGIKQSPVTQPQPQSQPQQQQPASSSSAGGDGLVSGWSKFQDSYLTFLKTPGGNTRRGRQSSSAASQHGTASVSSASSSPAVGLQPTEDLLGSDISQGSDKKSTEILCGIPDDKERAAPSPYCDFCLGDANENKKTGQSEELVSCSDCGRSGHPTCLQFTPNMIVSVHKYRWQCIECKCCSLCGTSDNDDQLLFCDDCDRGYHMYCLAPPLLTPPEGSWSCSLCIAEFHKK